MYIFGIFKENKMLELLLASIVFSLVAGGVLFNIRKRRKAREVNSRGVVDAPANPTNRVQCGHSFDHSQPSHQVVGVFSLRR